MLRFKDWTRVRKTISHQTNWSAPEPPGEKAITSIKIMDFTEKTKGFSAKHYELPFFLFKL